MTPSNYIECFFVALLGMAISTLLILNSLSRKAKKANLQFSISSYFHDEVFVMAANFLWIITAMLCINWLTAWKPEWKNFVVPSFFFIGYLGSDVASRLASVANAKLNRAIDYKTNIADEATGTLGAPTPTNGGLKEPKP